MLVQSCKEAIKFKKLEMDRVAFMIPWSKNLSYILEIQNEIEQIASSFFFLKKQKNEVGTGLQRFINSKFKFKEKKAIITYYNKQNREMERILLGTNQGLG